MLVYTPIDSYTCEFYLKPRLIASIKVNFVDVPEKFYYNNTTNDITMKEVQVQHKIKRFNTCITIDDREML